MFPYWEGAEGLLYKVAGYSTLNPDNVVIVHLASMDGHLDESVRTADIMSHFKMAPHATEQRA